MDTDQQAIINDRDKTIANMYHGQDGARPAYKTWLDAKAIDPRITLDWVLVWFKRSKEQNRSVELRTSFSTKSLS